MDDEREKEPTNLEILASCLASLSIIVSLLYCSLIFEVPGRGCLWDKIASYVRHTTAPTELALNVPSKTATDWRDALNNSPITVGKTSSIKHGGTPIFNRHHRSSVCDKRAHAFKK